jgi:hypothetical protein
MSRQYFEEPREPIAAGAFPAVATTAAEALLWNPAPWTAFAANELRAGQAWRLFATGIVTAPATPGTLVVQARFGSVIGGTTFGPTPAATGVAVTNVPWQIIATMMVRSTSTPTTAASGVIACAGTFESICCTRDLIFGGTILSAADTTTAQGLAITVTPSVAAWSFTPQVVLFSPLN